MEEREQSTHSRRLIKKKNSKMRKSVRKINPHNLKGGEKNPFGVSNKVENEFLLNYNRLKNTKKKIIFKKKTNINVIEKIFRNVAEKL